MFWTRQAAVLNLSLSHALFSRTLYLLPPCALQSKFHNRIWPSNFPLDTVGKHFTLWCRLCVVGIVDTVSHTVAYLSIFTSSNLIAGDDGLKCGPLVREVCWDLLLMFLVVSNIVSWHANQVPQGHPIHSEFRLKPLTTISSTLSDSTREDLFTTGE